MKGNNTALDIAASAYYDQDHIHSLQTIAAFKAGAQWQKEQVKHIMELSRNIIIAYHMRHPNEPQLLVNYNTEQALEKINAYLYGDNQS